MGKIASFVRSKRRYPPRASARPHRARAESSETDALATLPPQDSQPQRCSSGRNAGDLVAELVARRPGAIGWFFDLYGARIHRLLHHVLGPDEEICRYVYETFMRAIDAAHRLHTPVALEPWLARIALSTIRARLWLGWCRRLIHRIRGASFRSESCDTHRSGQFSFDVLCALPIAERVAVVLRHVQGMSVEDASAAAGVSVATLRGRLARAGRKLSYLRARSARVR
jgi:RNA polymerase sigma-70 factor (ECF subfamily)